MRLLVMTSVAACWTGRDPASSTPVANRSTTSDEATRLVEPVSSAHRQSLFDRIGGDDAFLAIVKDWVENEIARDTRINAMFANADIVLLEKRLHDQLCMIAGGPCSYRGRDMRSAHAGMGITAEQFDAMLEDLHHTLDKFKVRDANQFQLLDALAAMRGAVIGP